MKTLFHSSSIMVHRVNPPMKMPTFFIFLLLTSATATATATATTTTVHHHHHRRTLHQPFFPQNNPIVPPAEAPSPPPTQPPTALPPSPPPPPPPPPPLNIPFLSAPTPTTTPPDDQPFFQSFPSPPPPPAPSATATASASFPANISSLSLPTSPEPKKPSSKLIPIAITLAIAAFIILSIVTVLRVHKRRRNYDDSQTFSDEKPQRSNNDNGGNNNSNSYNRIPKLNRPSETSSEFLYLGTLVNSHGGIDTTDARESDNSGDGGSRLNKVGSPELRPLPPLSGEIGGRHTVLRHDGYETSEFEAFYSPRVSDGGGGATATAAVGGGVGSSSSYSSSSSGSPARSISLSISPPVSLSPRNSRFKSPDLVAFPTAPPPSRPAPSPPPPPRLQPPSPEVGLSKDSLESSPRLSNSSNDRNFSPVRIPPPPPPPAKLSEITPPAPLTRLNPPELIKPSRPVPVSTQQPHIFPIGISPENRENLETKEQTPKPKLKPLHWDKVKASSDREMVWDHLKSSSFKLNEEMMETLFIVKPPNPTNSNEKSPVKRVILPSVIDHDNQVLDPKKSQNISIAMRALNVTTEEVCDALLEGNVDALKPELLESLLKAVPTKEEERKLKDYRDDSPYKLGPAEKFLKAVLDVPFAFKRIGVMLYVSSFDSEVEYLKMSFQTLEAACEELRNNRMFLKLLEAVLKTGNRMNVGTNRGDAQAFKLDTLLKLIDVKGADGKTTLLHFVVQEITRTEGARLTNPTPNQTTKPVNGLQTISNLCSELSHVKKAAAMDSDVLKADVLKLSNGIANTINVVKLMESTKFSDSMSRFLKAAQPEVIKIQVQESETLSLVKEITEYFHGNSAKEEAHPLRIFMVVRDFLVVLDRVCKEVAVLNERMIVNSVHVSSVPVVPTAVFDGFHGRRECSSSDDESSSSL